MNHRSLPCRVDAEQAVLGGLMLAPEALPLVSDELAEGDFYRADHQLIFRSIRECAESGRPYDAVTMADWFQSRGLLDRVDNGAYLVELATTTPSAANVRAHARIVAEMAKRREMIAFGGDLLDAAFEADGREVPDILAEYAPRFGQLQPAQRGGLTLAADGLKGWFGQFKQRSERGERVTGLPTQWQALNECTHGLQPGTLYLVAARPSMGKSVFGLNLATFNALRGKTVGLFSLEMSQDDCHTRNVASLGEVPHDWLSAPVMGDEDSDLHVSRMTEAIGRLKTAQLYIDDTAGITVRQFEARARRLHYQHPLDLLIVDHIHDFKINAKEARFEYGAIAQAGKALAKEWGIPVVMLAQLNRNVAGRQDRRPTLMDLRESGELEQKADVIVFLHREDYYDTPDKQTHLQGVLEMHIAKGRNVKSGARLNFRNRFDQMRIDDWTGPLPVAVASAQSIRNSRGFGGGKRRAANDMEDF
ncbi:MAG: Replicative DNA helicase [Stenotrophomonas maltophilia]|uniref:DNA 5'-3' helicase n=1 Tax=Stenotrophomonas maltophilia TaxID=40324 RepID=A0A7V8FKA5_STEMA|nr:MAG: Replicative DNA helicase [Stenotrophomonas maltophilia]